MAALCASRWSAVRCTVDTTKKKGLTRAGLLIEVARYPLRTAHETPASGISRSLYTARHIATFHAKQASQLPLSTWLRFDALY